MKRAIAICGSVVVTVFLAGTAAVDAQTPTASSAPPPAQGSDNKTPPFKKEELESILAPIALYPDALLAQIFMASTYPLEVVEAARWSKDHPDVKGDAVAGAVQSQTWDPSVKSLCAFPSVLTMMNEKIDWTQKLGDAFLAQQKEVMQSVQVLRNKAKDTGNLKSTKEVTVKQEPAPAGSPAPQTIIIESPDPEVVYVPSYNPTVVYGAWSYPYYPPYYYYPPGYVAGAAFWSFTAGVIVGGAIWGNCNWGGNDIDIDINRQNNFNRNEINNNRNNINSNNRGNNNRAGNNSGNKQSWSHNAEHRKGVGYKDSATQQKFNRGGNQAQTQAREQYRGRAEQGRNQMSREGLGNQRDMSGNSIGTSDRGGGTRDLGGASNRDVGGGASRDLGGGGTRDLGGASTRDLGGGSSSRDLGGSNRSSSRSSSAFGGGSGSSARASSSRGGMSRGGGGMSRGGGGGRRR
ncbi:MAG: DUF3300 domain-containing protein [Peristeroidobacter soli]